MFYILWSILVGFIAGLIARALLPGGDHMGFLATAGAGIAGSVIGGLLGTVLRKPVPGSSFHPAGFAMSVVGAMILIYCLRYLH